MVIDSLQEVSGSVANTVDMWPLAIAKIALFALVLIALPLLAIWVTRKHNGQMELRGLALPKGSVRSMLALMIVGSYLIVLVLGSGTAALENHYTEILGALSGIAGAVVGFYFGSRGSGKSPDTK